IREEEIDFLRTIERGLDTFEFAVDQAFQQAYSRERERIRGFKQFGSSVGLREQGRPSITYYFERLNGPSVVLRYPYDPSAFKRAIEGVFEQPITITGHAIFDLHTTHGFPPDLTRQIAEERGLAVDLRAYEELMREHERISRRNELTSQVALN